MAAVAAKYGGRYYTERAERHLPTSELWRDLGRQGFIGINIPEEYGGGGAGLTELALVCEETAAQGGKTEGDGVCGEQQDGEERAAHACR